MNAQLRTSYSSSRAQLRSAYADSNRKVRIRVHGSALGSTVSGIVFTAPTGANPLVDAIVGQFSGITSELAVDAEGMAVFLVPTTTLGDTSLTTADTPLALIEDDDNTTGLVSCTVIEG